MAAPTAFLALLIQWDRDVIFLMPLTLLASLIVSALSAGNGQNRRWGFHGLIAGIVGIILSFIALVQMVD